MPIHDWTRVPAGLFQHFHQDWTIEIARTLNRGMFPKGLTALVEQRASTREGDVLAIESKKRIRNPENAESGGLLTAGDPATSIVRRLDREIYAARANRIVLRHHMGRVVAVIEIVSPGNKDRKSALREFVTKSVQFIDRGIHLLVVDLFPPSSRDPFGIHKAIWDEFLEEDFTMPPGKDRIVASYEADEEKTAYVEPIGVGDALPSMPLFVKRGMHVRVPLEATYRTTWEATGEEMRNVVETGVLPEMPDDDET
jgi:Protein of unknown function (DUF4058)